MPTKKFPFVTLLDITCILLVAMEGAVVTIDAPLDLLIFQRGAPAPLPKPS